MLGSIGDDQLTAMVSSFSPSRRAAEPSALMRAVATATLTLAAGTGAGCGGAEEQGAWDSVKLPAEACANDYNPTWGSRPHPSECEEPEPKPQPETMTATEFFADLPEEEAVACFQVWNLIHHPPPAGLDPDDPLPIPEDHRTVLEPEGVGSPPEGFVYTSVSGEEIERANRAAVRHLAHMHGSLVYSAWERESVDRIIRLLPHYYVQYFGMQSPDGGRKVVCNFFFVLPPNDCPEFEAGPQKHSPDWRTKLLHVKGGGADFWTATYDVAARAVTSFRVNSPK